LNNRGYISLIMSLFPNAVDYRAVKPKKSHYMLIDKYGRKYYLILTSRVLRYPPAIDISYSGEMLGINRSDLYEIQREGNYVLVAWGLKRDDKVYVYAALLRDVLKYVGMFSSYRSSTCRRVRGSEEVVCHYPITKCRLVGIIRRRTLNEYFKGDK